jgi:hypothetical protein
MKSEKAAKEAAQKSGREAGNLEDQLRVANELLRGLEILGNSAEAETLLTELTSTLEAFSKSILESEAGIARAGEDKREQALNVLVTFLMSFASRTGVRDRLNIFTTNYDRLIEAGPNWPGCICWTASSATSCRSFARRGWIWTCTTTRQAFAANRATWRE